MKNRPGDYNNRLAYILQLVNVVRNDSNNKICSEHRETLINKRFKGTSSIKLIVKTVEML